MSFQMPDKILNAPNKYINGGTHTTGSGFNFRAAPFAQRLSNNPDTSKLFSSAVHGDPALRFCGRTRATPWCSACCTS